MDLGELYESDTEAGRKFRHYIDYWIRKPGFERPTPTKEELFEHRIVKNYAEYLMKGNYLETHGNVGISGINGIESKTPADDDDLIDDKSC